MFGTKSWTSDGLEAWDQRPVTSQKQRRAFGSTQVARAVTPELHSELQSRLKSTWRRMTSTWVVGMPQILM
jgi:hypothetical protein